MRILFVEDEADTRLVVGAGLELHGFSVRMAEDGPTALQALRESSFDAVVTDVSMPHGVSGIEVAEEALKRQPTAKVLIVSGYARAQLPKLPDHVSFLGKPYGLADLVSILRGMLGSVALVGIARFAGVA